MSIWFGQDEQNVAFSDGTLFGAFDGLSIEYKWWDSESDDCLEEMNKLGWGLIAPATLSRWSD